MLQYYTNNNKKKKVLLSELIFPVCARMNQLISHRNQSIPVIAITSIDFPESSFRIIVDYLFVKYFLHFNIIYSAMFILPHATMNPFLHSSAVSHLNKTRQIVQ